MSGIKYDGNFRCLDIFPLSEVGKFMLARNKAIKIMPPFTEKEELLEIGDNIFRDENGKYTIEKCNSKLINFWTREDEKILKKILSTSQNIFVPSYDEVITYLSITDSSREDFIENVMNDLIIRFLGISGFEIDLKENI